MRGKRNKKFIRIVYILIVLILILIFARKIMGGAMGVLKNIINPVQSSIYSIGKNAKDKTQKVLDYKRLVNIETELERAQNEKAVTDEKVKLLMDENKRLRELLNLKGEFAYNFKIGRIDFMQSRELYESFTIDIGKNDGIKKDMPVLHRSSLIGRVKDVGAFGSQIQMITYQDSAVSAVANGTITGLVKGNRSDELVFEPELSHKANLQKGVKIYTSGISDIYPKGLYIGEISEVRKEKNTIKYIVKLPFNILDINEVVVLTNNKQ